MHNIESTQTIPGSRWVIQAEQVGLRLDRYLTGILGSTSRTVIQELVTEGAVLVNGKPSKPGYNLRKKDEVQVLRMTSSVVQEEVVARVFPLDIAYEDKDILVVNKAAGMVVHPAPGHADDTLVNALVAYYPQLKGSEEKNRPGIVHRLDKETSGLLIVAKDLRTQGALIDLMKQHKIEKRYIVLVEGVMLLDKGSIDAPIGRDRRHRQQMTITSVEGREARTHFKVLERYRRHTLVEVKLETGRTHQIRVHMRGIGHAVVGDGVYGEGRGVREEIVGRQFLHAYRVSFEHPWERRNVEVEVGLPEDLKRGLERVREGG